MLLKGLNKFLCVLDRVYMAAAGVLFIILIAASATQVFTRYVLNASLVGTEELARYCFIWMSLLGGSIAVGQWAHTSITVLYDILPQVPKKVTFCIQNMFIIILSVIFVMGGLTMMSVSGKQFTPTLHIPKYVIYLAVPLCGFGMGLHALQHILNTIFGKSTEAASGKEEIQ